LNFTSNGYLVKQINRDTMKNYLGVENGNWPLEPDADNIDETDRDELIRYVNENIDISWGIESHVDVCTDFDFVVRYANACIASGVEVEILYCKTSYATPVCDEPIEYDLQKKYKFLGYDIAYSGGSYYSCVFSDVFTGRIPVFSEIQLNEYGLIENEDELQKFIMLRDAMTDELKESIEQGEFVIYKLWKLKRVG